MIKKIVVTGTKGKSTVLRLLEQVFMDLNRNVYGTYGIDGYYYNKKMIRDGTSCEDYLVWDNRKYPTDIHLSEGTSFTLGNNYYDNYEIDAGVFTSFDIFEHEEIHPEKGSYLAAKKVLFECLSPEAMMVVNRDIKNFQDIVAGWESRITTYGFHPESNYRLTIKTLTKEKMNFTLGFNDKEILFKTNLVGEFNAKNIAAAFVACKNLGLDDKTTRRSLERFTGLAGRMERYCVPQTNNDVIIDYAHTYESLDSLLSFCKTAFPDKDLITVFGCGGDKSKSKRQLMGKVSDKYSAFTILTNDNPRTENPAGIVQEITQGIDSDDYVVILDRQEAIKASLSRCKNAVIVLAGKGSETSIQLDDINIPHSDYKCLVEWCIQNNLRLVSYN